MKKITEQYFCDTCKKKINSSNKEQISVCVVFTTEQTEGRPTKPYISANHKLDLCEACEANLFEGNMIFGSGAQGFNEYSFRNYDK